MIHCVFSAIVGVARILRLDPVRPEGKLPRGTVKYRTSFGQTSSFLYILIREN